MAYDRISDSRMYEEIVEVMSELRLTDFEIEFLENPSVQEYAEDDNLSPGRRKVLERIYEKACRSKH